jgi:hypothetical protein
MTGLPLACFRRRPARTGVPLRTGDRLGLPIDREVRQVIAGLGLILVIASAWDPSSLLHS